MTSKSRTPDAQRLNAARQALAEATAAASESSPSAGPREGADRSERAPAPAHQDVDSAADGEGMARARQIALRQLAMGPRTRAQLRQKMRDRECSPEVIERVLERMSAVGLVDDQAYAHMLVRAKGEGSGLAVRGLRHALQKKGVPPEMAEVAIAEVEPAQEYAQAQALVAARLPRLHGLDREVQMRRLGGFLARKGYPAGLSFAVIKEALDQAPEHQRD
ncbi:MAG: regulatory protein RecX [Ornithinimicrobium sp.]